MKLQARNFVVRKPETIDITMFFKKFCIATRTKSRRCASAFSLQPPSRCKDIFYSAVQKMKEFS